MRSLIEGLPVVVYVGVADCERLTPIYVSPNVQQMLGYSQTDWQRDPQLFSRMVHPDDRSRVLTEQQRAPIGEEAVIEYRVLARDGREVWIRDRHTASGASDGRSACIRGVLEDVTALRQAEHRFREVLENISLLAVTRGRDGRIEFANDHFLEVTGTRREDVYGRDWFDTFVPERNRLAQRDAFRQAMETGVTPRHGETCLLTATGDERLVRYTNTLVVGRDGAPEGLTSIAEDITAARRAEEQLHRLMHYDQLTGLPNRTHFASALEAAIEAAAARTRAVGVMFVSLDDFALVNDSLGPRAGDELLRQFAGRLSEAASAAVTVGHLGGDEFLVLLADMEPGTGAGTHDVPEDVAQMGRAIGGRLQSLLRRPFNYDRADVFASATVGIAIYPQDGSEADALLKAALLDRYRAPGPGGGELRRRATGLDPSDELAMRAGLHRAIDERAFTLVYQPIVRLGDRAVIAAEALLRWNNAQGRPVPPGLFIPLAERTGLIAPITEWLVEEVCRQRSDWRAAGIEIDLGFNFSSALWDGRRVAAVLDTVRRFGLEPADVVMEITESTAVQDETATATVSEMLGAAGMRLAIDDFGTGYSSLSRLRHLNAATIKVDRSFVRDVPDDADAAAVVSTIVRLAESIGAVALAEGIETEAQRRFLLELGCLEGQGYLFSRPVPAAEVERLWRSQQRRAAA